MALAREYEIADEREAPAELPPWVATPYQLVSWWDMEKFAAETFFSIGMLMQKLKEEIRFPPGDQPFNFSGTIIVKLLIARGILNVLKLIEGECRRISLRVSAGQISGFMAQLQASDQASMGYLLGRISALEEAIQTEMRENVFFFLPAERKIYYEQPLKEWDEVLRRFPKLTIDIEESSKSFAFDRYAASIFHILLVAEYGVIQVAQLFGVAGDKPGWGALDRLENIHKKEHKDKSDLEKKHSQFLEHVIPLMLAIKDAWRHKISHVENKLIWMDTAFTPQIAEEIILSTRGFMRRLGTDLPK